MLNAVVWELAVAAKFFAGFFAVVFFVGYYYFTGRKNPGKACG